MTPLQQGVIQRLRERGYTALANMAYEAWSKDEPLPIADTPSTAPENQITDLAKTKDQAAA